MEISRTPQGRRFTRRSFRSVRRRTGRASEELRPTEFILSAAVRRVRFLRGKKKRFQSGRLVYR